MIDLPVATVTKDDKLAFCFRAAERLRLWHNERGLLVLQKKLSARDFREWVFVEFNPRQRKVFERLNSLRDQRSPRLALDPCDPKNLAVEDQVIAVKGMGKADSSWDQWITPDQIGLAGSREVLPDPTENFTTYTEHDSNGVLTVDSATKVSVAAGSREEHWRIVKSYGAAHFGGDFEHKYEAREGLGDGGGVLITWFMANAAGLLDDPTAMDIAEESFFYARYGNVAGPVNRIVLVEFDSGTPYQDLYNDTYNVLRYNKLYRDEAVGAQGTLYHSVYSDSGHSTLVDTQSVALHTSKKDFQYVGWCGNYGGANNDEVTGYVQNADLQEPVTDIAIFRRRRSN